MTDKDILEKLQLGRSLVLFDNLVLDVNGYERMHPGGKFNITHNYGRDISKFFFGGYTLVNNGKKTKKPHTHSKAALDIIKTMVVGVIDSQEIIQDELFRISNKNQVNDSTATFTFTSIDNEPIANFKQWYSDPAMIGRHFLVFNVQNPSVKRHYTICSSMQPLIFTELINMANNLISGNPFTFDSNLLA